MTAVGENEAKDGEHVVVEDGGQCVDGEGDRGVGLIDLVQVISSASRPTLVTMVDLVPAFGDGGAATTDAGMRRPWHGVRIRLWVRKGSRRKLVQRSVFQVAPNVHEPRVKPEVVDTHFPALDPNWIVCSKWKWHKFDQESMVH